MQKLQTLVDQEPVDAVSLAQVVEDKTSEKHDPYLNEELLCWNYASSHLDPRKAWETLRAVVRQP